MIGQTISHYKILKKLGASSMRVVYDAVDTNLDRRVALKFLPPESTRDPDAKARFVHEAEVRSRVGDVPDRALLVLLSGGLWFGPSSQDRPSRRMRFTVADDFGGGDTTSFVVRVISR